MNRPSGCIALFLCLCGPAALAAPAATPGSSWLDEAERELARREYRASTNDAGLQAPNRAQGFRTYFDGHGVRLVARSGGSEPLAAIALAGAGRGRDGRAANLRAPGVAEVAAEGARITLRWPGVEASYGNETTGLHQTITLERRPPGTGRLSLGLRVTDASVQTSGDAALLQGAAGTLRLGAVSARDAIGRALPVTLSTEADSLLVAIDDRHARYPISVKSVLDRDADAVLESNQGNAKLGTSVAGAGDVNGDGFADVVVGADFYDNGQSAEGAAFVYLGGAGGFDTTHDALLEKNQPSARFGYSVAGAGDVNGDGFADVVVGAITYDNGQMDEGAAFVFFGGAGPFDVTADAQLESNQVNGYLGLSVAGAGDVNGDGFADVIVGAPYYDNGQSEEGAAFVYLGGAGIFDTDHDALLEQNQAGAGVGSSVGGAGDVNGDGFADVIVGAPYYDNGQSDEGAAFVYFGGAGAFNPSHDALLESNQANARLGMSVAGAGDVNGDGYADLVVGADLYDNGESDEGAALVYFGSAGTFNGTPDALLESNQPDARLGLAVAGAGDVNGDGFGDVIAGAIGYDDGEFNEGAAFVYFGGAGTFDSTADAELQANLGGAQMGVSVAGAGDVNGDGYADVIVGANGYANGEAFEGAALVYFGGAGAFNLGADAQLLANQAGARGGTSVAGAGDVNGDGFDDVIVGAPLYDDGEADEGAAFLYFGGAGTFDGAFDARLEANAAGAQFGTGVAGAGDVNGDGFADVLVGAPYYDNGQTDEGAIFVYFGGAGAFDGTFDARLEANQTNAFMGRSFAGAGDVNGDGYTDVIAAFGTSAAVYFGGAGAFDGTRDAELTGGSSGFASVAAAGDVNGDGYADVVGGSGIDAEVRIFFGGAGAFDPGADAVLTDPDTTANYGDSVAGAGDVNGDGFADVIVGAAEYDGDSSPAGGAVLVYLGGAGAFNLVRDAIMYGAGAIRLGFSVAGAGDINGDGYADIIAGSRYYPVGSEDGAAFVYYGGPGPFDVAFDARLTPPQALARMGNSVAGAGDVNGDGFADVIVGAPGADRAFVFLGTASGRPVLPSQYRGDGTTAVRPWGLSQQADGFVVSLEATSPRGRERARLEVEACPNGAPFGSLLCDTRTAATWTDLGTDPLGSTLVLPVAGLTVNRVYHWRARAQYAALTVTAPGTVAPPNPAAGPWRRLQASADVADIRTNTPMLPLIFASGFE